MALKTCMSCGRKFTPVGFIGQVLSDNAGSLRCPDCVRQDQSDDRYAAHAHSQSVAAQAAAQATIESQERQAQAAERLAHERGLAVRQLAQAQAEATLATAVAGMDDDGLRRYQAQQEAAAARPVLDDAATEIALAAEVVASEGASYGGRIVDPYAERGAAVASPKSGANETSGATPAQGIQEVHAWGNIDHAYSSMARVYERLRALRLQGEAVDHRNQMMEQADDLGRRLMHIRGPASSRAVTAVERVRFRVRSVSAVLGVVGFLCVIMSVLLDSTWSFGLAAFFAIDFALIGFLMPFTDPSSGKYPPAWGLLQSHAGPPSETTKFPVVHPAAVGMSSVFVVATIAVVGYAKLTGSDSATDEPMESGVVPHIGMIVPAEPVASGATPPPLPLPTLERTRVTPEWLRGEWVVIDSWFGCPRNNRVTISQSSIIHRWTVDGNARSSWDNTRCRVQVGDNLGSLGDASTVDGDAFQWRKPEFREGSDLPCLFERTGDSVLLADSTSSCASAPTGTWARP